MTDKTSIPVDKDTAKRFRKHRDKRYMTNDEFLNYLINNDSIKESRKELIDISEKLLDVLQSESAGDEQ